MRPCGGPWAIDSLNISLLNSSPEARVMRFPKKRIIYSHGDLANCAFYILSRHIKLALLRAGDFLGEGCVSADQPLRTTSAVSVSDCSLLRIDREFLIRRLQQEKALSDLFLAYIIRRAHEFQEHLVDHLINHAEQRLARILLTLACISSENRAEATLPAINRCPMRLCRAKYSSRLCDF